MDSILRGNTKASSFFKKPFEPAIIIFGGLIMTTWTLIRFFNHSPNFDQFGQQVLAHQWLNGEHAGSVIGPTNYVIKILFIYMPADLIPLPAQLKLIVITILVNILAFILIFLGLKKLLIELLPSLKPSAYTFTPLIYLALISGSTFWISFSNSRNLEVAGGIFLIYFYLKAAKSMTTSNLARAFLLGAVLFFADPLQIYMTLLPVLVFIGLDVTLTAKKLRLKPAIKLLACALLSVVFAKLVTKLVERLWSVSFIHTDQLLSLQLASFKQAVSQMARLYAGGYEGGRLREGLDLLVVLVTALAVVYYARVKPGSRRLLGLAGSVWIIDLLIYAFSGQALQSDTNRYLIMTVPMLILAMCVVVDLSSKIRAVKYIVSVILLVNITTLAYSFAVAWDPHFRSAAHQRSAISYMQSHNYRYGYASIGTAISSNYLSDFKVKLLPIGCEPNFSLKKTNLFYDKAGFNIESASDPGSKIPIILDGSTIKINQSACQPAHISKQIGQPLYTEHLSDGSIALIYKANQLQRLPLPL